MVPVEKFEFPEDLSYDVREHIWLRQDGERVVIGLDSLSLEALGNIVHIEVSAVGTVFAQGEDIGSLEAEKMVTSIVAPISGTVVERNETAILAPGAVLDDPYGEGWLVAVEPDGPLTEEGDLVRGEEAIQNWAETEVARYTDNGWV